MRRNILLAGAGASALLLVLAACSGTGGTSDGDAKAGGLVGSGSGDQCKISQEIPVSAAFSLTGAAAQYGAGQKNALELAVANLNKAGTVTYKLTVEDDQTDPKQGIQLFEQFVSNGTSVIVGPTLVQHRHADRPGRAGGQDPGARRLQHRRRRHRARRLRLPRLAHRGRRHPADHQGRQRGAQPEERRASCTATTTRSPPPATRP